ncbi:MAG: Macrolide export ATP-binding/permease protein MacB [Firmicutes bacterium ADurb.Bin193]|nr:MAG: Macrolide export ATP-binding/permease protein MacB [Firmicutes bacterium ADurb.Bin193]
MNISQAVKMAIQSVTSNKMRSFLTMLGIIIGVAAVIIMVSIVQATTARIKAQMENMGTNMISVTLTGRNSTRNLDINDMQKLVADNPDYFICVAPTITGNPRIKVGTVNESTNLIGSNQHYSSIHNATVEFGRFISEQDCITRRKVVVIGKYIQNHYFPGEDPIGQILKVSNQVFTVVGVLEAKTSTIAQGSQDDRIIIPYTTAQRLLRNAIIRTYSFQAVSAEVSEKATDKLEELLLKLLRNENAYRVMNQAEMLENVETMTETMSLMLGGIAGISLLVGGIGIMNIMLVSVTERTREIGIRKAIGARRRSIMTQFLIESIVVSCLGGIIGILLGIVGTYLVGRAINLEAVATAGVMILSAGFSITIGVFFGWYPANKASKLDPIDALRFE